jgi:hypothetical protein
MRAWLGVLVVALAMGAVLGCGGKRSGMPRDGAVGDARGGVGDARGDADVDPACVGQPEGMYCGGGAPLNETSSCQGGRCLPGCQGDAARKPCVSYPDLGTACCAADERCCFLFFENVGCRPGAVPCPRTCGDVYQLAWECPAEQTCVLQFPYPGFAPEGTCGNYHATGPGGCTTACPPEQQCGSECCGLNTRCHVPDGGGYPCCAASVWDGGPETAGTDGPADAGAD